VISGELSRAGELLLGPLRHTVERSVIVGRGAWPDIVPGQLGMRAATMGAVMNAVERMPLHPELDSELDAAATNLL
jgi:hypothetical protein